MLCPFAACDCGTSEDGERFGRFRQRSEQVLHYNNFEEPEYIDPGLLSGQPDGFVAAQLFEGLTEPHPRTLAPRPGAAESWTVSDDGLVYRFRLRKGARWSDGREVTAPDFVYSWERVLRPSTAARNAYQLYPIRGARDYSRGVLKRVTSKGRAPRRPPYVTTGDHRLMRASSLQPFEQGTMVRLIDSNLRRGGGDEAVDLYEEPGGELKNGVLLPGEVGLVLLRRVPEGARDEPGAPSPDTWVQLRPPERGKSGWARERDLAPAFPSVNLRHVDGERLYQDRMALRAEARSSGEILGYADDDDEVDLLERGERWGRVFHLRSGRVGWVPLESLDDVQGDRHFYFVRVVGAAVEGPAQPDAYAREGWLPGRYLFADASVLGVRAVSDRELEVTLERPTPYFVSLTSFAALRPVPRRAVETHGRAWTRPENIVTSGPFHLRFHHPRDRMELVRSLTYWGVKDVKLSRAIIYAISDTHTNVNLYRSGYLDAMISAKLPVELVAGLTGRPDYEAGPYLATYFVRLNTFEPPLDDVRVRRALNLAIDKGLLTSRLLKAGQDPATHIVPPGLPGYPVVEGADFDPARARELLAEAGFPGGEGFPRLEFLFNTSEDHRLIAEYLQQQWQQNLGVKIALSNQEWKTYLKKLHASDYQLARSGWIGDYVDPNTFLELWKSGAGNNDTGYANPAYDALVEAAAREVDPDRRLAKLAEAEALLNRDVPFLPLFFYVNNYLLAPEVKGFHNNLLDEHPLKDVWIELPAEGQGG